MALTPEDHKKRHIELHESLDELVCDWIAHSNRQGRPSTTPVLDLMNWSHRQKESPTHEDGGL